MAEFFQVSSLINLASKMDSRTSNEYLNMYPNFLSFEMVNLVNADLFNTKALSSRLGTVDLGGGVINASGSPIKIYSYYPADMTSPSGQVAVPVYLANTFQDREGMILNFASGSGAPGFNIISGNILLKDTAPSGTSPEIGYDISVRMYLTAFQHNAFSSGSSIFVDDGGNHSLSASGNFNYYNQYPQLINATNSSVFAPFTDAVPLAISEQVIVNFGPSSNYTSGNAAINTVLGTPWQTVPFQFSAPYPFSGTMPYYLKIVANNTSGTAVRGLQAEVIYASGDGILPGQQNAMYANEFFDGYSSVIRPQEGGQIASGNHAWLQGEIDKYNPASYAIFEYPTVTQEWVTPVSGANYYGGLPFWWGTSKKSVQTNGIYNSGIPTFNTSNLEFGNILSLPSGTYSIDGAYIYANTYSGNGYNTFSSKGTPLSTNKYVVNYVTNFYEVTNTSVPYTTNLLASYTGTHIFNNQNTYQDSIHELPMETISSDLDKLTAIFPNPAVFTTDGSKKYLLSYQFFDSVTGEPLQDFGVETIFGFDPSTGGNSYYYKFISPILVGVQPSVGTDQFVCSSASGTNFGLYGQTQSTLSCGLISIPANNGITLVYDYSIGSSRSEKIIIGQTDKLYSSKFSTPQIRDQIFSGAPINNEYLWTATTYQNLFFGSQYGNSGTQVCWDQIYSQPSGNWTQPWGLRPSWSMYPVSGTVTTSGNPAYSGESLGYGLMSGNSVQVMLATQMESGGYRAQTQTFIASGNNIYIQLSGTDIFRESGTDANSQYKFDVVPQATYVFVTQAADSNGNAISGLSPNGNTTPATTNIFYLAEILSKPSGLSQVCVNPLTNSGTFAGSFLSNTGALTPNPYGKIFLGNFDANTLTQQIPNIINQNQSYLDQQVNVPPFKKVTTFYNYVIGVGSPDFPSRMWYCAVGNNGGQPQIWGTDGQAAGYYEVEPDDGSPITGMAVFRDNLFVFKYNAIYRYTYTGNPTQPFQRYTMSNKLGSLGFFTTVESDYGIFFLSQFGPALVSIGPPDTIADEITPTYSQFDHTNLTFAVGIYDRLRQQVLWSISSDVNSPSNQTGLVYNTSERAWGLRQGAMWNSAGIIYDLDNFNQLWIGTSQGQLQQIQTGNVDSDTVFVDVDGNSTVRNISLVAETPWFNVQNSENLKRLKSLKMNCDTSAQILKIDVYYDQNMNNPYTRYLNMSNAVVQRVISFGGRPCRTVKLKITSVGNPGPVKLNSMQFGWSDFGPSTPF